MPGFVISDSDVPRFLGLAQGRIDCFASQGMPILSGDNDDGDDTDAPSVDPQRSSKREVAHCFGVTLSDVDKWVREGCPHGSTGKLRAPLVFNLPQVWRWRLIHESYTRGDDAGKLAEKDVEIWNLELVLEVGRQEAARILGLAA